MTTGERIRERRKAIGMTAFQLGEAIGVAKSTIGRYERGTIQKIPYEHLFRIAIAMGTTVAELTGAMKKSPPRMVSPGNLLNLWQDLKEAWLNASNNSLLRSWQRWTHLLKG